MASDTDVDILLVSLNSNVVKTKSFYDGSNRVTSRYEAVANSIHGGPALKTDYTYVGATTFVDASKESMGAWDSSWDI